MIKIDLSIYKKSKPYFLVFDVLLKNLPIKKEVYLSENGINPSSYRLSRKHEQKIGFKILRTLCDRHDYKIMDNDLIDNLERRINQIYFNIYYKIYDTFDDDLNYIQDLINQNYIIFPILKLMKVMLLSNTNKGIDNLKEDCLLEYKEIVKYEDFFNEELTLLYDNIKLLYDEFNINECIQKKSKNPMYYYSLSGMTLIKEKYAESMYFIDICEKLLLEDNNYKRLLFLNLNKLRCKLYFKQYDECFDLARSIMYTLESFNMSKTKEMLFALYYYFTCLLITKDYNRIVDEVEKVFNITLSIYAVYQIALYHTDKEEYEKLINEFTVEKPNKEKDFIIAMNDYLTNKNPKAFNNCKYNVDSILLDIIKSNNFYE